MIGSFAPEVASLIPWEFLLERIARLAEAEAIAVLAVVPDLGGPIGKLSPIAAYGLSLDEFEDQVLARANAILKEFSHTGAYPQSVPNATLGTGSSSRCFAVPLAIQHGGLAIVAFPPHAEDDGRIQCAMELVSRLAAHEICMAGKLAVSKTLSARHVERKDEAERRLAQEIHDDLSQNVTLIRLTLTSMKRQREVGRTERWDADLEEVDAASSAVKDAVQKLSSRLRPAMIETVGPVPAIRQEAKRHEMATGARVRCELEDFAVAGRAALAAYRIVQESLDNIARHARATEVAIGAKCSLNKAIFSIEDNGAGFDLRAVAARSLGLSSMIERAEMAGGTLTIESTPGTGTRVTATFPVASEVIAR